VSNSTLYDRDFYAWSQEQAALLRDGKLSQADIAHIAEEIESMGKAEKRELINRLSVLLMHLLKWQFQPSARGTSWRLTIEEQRDRLADHLADNPSLKDKLDTSIASGYRLAILGAARETGFDRAIFPTVCPWSFAQILADDFWPEA
jgi:FMN phosphatase YigB (HAD superfamily)